MRHFTLSGNPVYVPYLLTNGCGWPLASTHSATLWDFVACICVHVRTLIRVIGRSSGAVANINYPRPSESISGNKGLWLGFFTFLLIWLLPCLLCYYRNWVLGISEIVVSTSNRAPDHLCEDGLQSNLFLLFFSPLKELCVVYEIGPSTDYRKLTSAQQGLYLVAKILLKERVQELVGGCMAIPTTFEVVMGCITGSFWSQWLCLFPVSKFL